MYRHLAHPSAHDGLRSDVARSGQLDALIALQRIGTRFQYSRNQGSMPRAKAAASGARFWPARSASPSCGPTAAGTSLSSALPATRLVSTVPPSASFRPKPWLMPSSCGIPGAATERLIDNNPAVARFLQDATLKSLAAAQSRLALLGRMTASERVASFLLEPSERCDDRRHVALPMCRCDIADYLGLTVETVCRELSDLKRRKLIEVRPHSITLLDRFALEAIGEE